MGQDHVIGIMSGSSLDGLSMALCRFDELDGKLKWNLLDHQTLPFPESISHALKNAPLLDGKDLMQLDASFGKFIGLHVKEWMELQGVRANYIASHGHTVFHEPRLGFTTQIGSGAHIANETGLLTITSFRSADVAAKGQGAPFAPVVDRALIPGYDGYLNLGGIANINLLTEDRNWKAWDIGPCNQALNFLALKMGGSFDEGGKIAASGNDSEDIIDALLSMFPPNEGQPKGLSNAEVKDTWIKFLEASQDHIPDLLASVTEAISRLILNHIVPIIKTPCTIMVTGGGAHNTYLVTRLSAMASDFGISFQFPSREIIDYKECLLMAYLGYLTMHERTYGIMDVTGAAKETIGGAIFKATR